MLLLDELALLFSILILHNLFYSFFYNITHIENKRLLLLRIKTSIVYGTIIVNMLIVHSIYRPHSKMKYV